MDPWEHLSDFEKAALQTAEEKYRVAKPQENPFAASTPLHTAEFFGVRFYAYAG